MSRFSLAWKILTSPDLAQRVAGFLQQPAASSVSAPSSVPDPEPEPEPKVSGRSEAITLLADLQREARLIDFLKEPIDAYTDAQIGAAVRTVHRDCGSVLERQFAIRPVVDQPEGSAVSSDQLSAAKLRITGAGGNPVLMHHGWQATRCDPPRWNGAAEDSLVLNPAEAEARPG